MYDRLLKRRHECDYEDFAQADEEEVRDWLPQAEVLIAALRALVDTKTT